MLLQVIAFRCVVIVISVEMAIFIPGSLAGISLQFARECQGPFVFNLHQDLINRGIQGGEVCEPPWGFGASVVSFVSHSCHLSALILPGFLMPFSLLGLLLTG